MVIKRIKKILCIIISILFAVNLISCKNIKDPLDISFFALDTMIYIKVVDYDDKNKALEYLQKCKSSIENFENNMSKTIETSQVYMYNHKLINFDDLNDDIKYIVNQVDDFRNNISDLFDINIGKLIDVWDQAKVNKVLPNDEDIKNAIEVKQLDLGGVAKGYIADMLHNMAYEYNVKSCIINLGGNVYAHGDKNGEDFTVGINMPFDDGKIADTVRIKNKSVVTSGIYQRYYKIDGDDTIYHHILDKRTGYPSNSDIISASVVCDNSCIADMLATACVIVGINEARDLLEKAKNYYKKDMNLIVIDKNYNIIRY